MLEAARIFGCMSAVLLIGVIAAWIMLSRAPKLERLGGSTPQSDIATEVALRFLVMALALSAVAAVLAVASWISV
jgi:hypothetical protein